MMLAARTVVILGLLIGTSNGLAAGQACSDLFASQIRTPLKMFNAQGQEIDALGNPINGPKVSAPTIVTGLPIQIYNVEKISELYEASSARGDNAAELTGAYKKMMDKGGNRFAMTAARLDMLDPLYETMPNFKVVLDRIKRSIAVAVAAGEPIVLPQIILLGPPGVGKTFFAEQLAQVIGSGYGFIPMNTTTAGWILSGAYASWKGATMGKVARILIEGKTANPVILVDEIDKAGRSREYDPLASFYQLWEKTSRNFVDEFLQTEIDASHVNWIATANYKDQIPDPILSRAIVIDVPAPSREQLRIIVGQMLKNYLAKHPTLSFSPKISEEVFAALEKHTPRDIGKLLSDAVGGAVLAQRTELRAEDIDQSVVEQSEPKKAPIGFIHHK